MNGKSADAVFGNWFKDQGDEARNPVKLAQFAMRTPLPEKFYKHADFASEGDRYHLLLDGRKARTPSKNYLAVKTGEAASLLAAEWNAQERVINPAEMHVTRIINAAIDHVTDKMADVSAEIVKYAGSDLICYRAGEPDKLVERQRAVWDPVVDWMRDQFGIRLNLAEGVIFVAQSPQTIGSIHSVITSYDDPVALSALHVLTTLSGSVALALAVAKGHMSATDAYDASELEADFTAEVWGVDEEALYRRQRRKSEFDSAARLLRSIG